MKEGFQMAYCPETGLRSMELHIKVEAKGRLRIPLQRCLQTCTGHLPLGRLDEPWTGALSHVSLA
jgi:hypothetical protein